MSRQKALSARKAQPSSRPQADLKRALKIPASWPASSISIRPISSIKLNPQNSRTHSEQQIAEIAASMKQFGWTSPVLLDPAGALIAGEGRVRAAQLLGYDLVPCLIAKGWSEAMRRAYAIADNKIALGSGWDDSILATELKALEIAGFDLALTGFSTSELGDLLNPGAAGGGAGSLAAKFGIPPFSVLDARQGWWQDRKAAWLALGIESEIGRGGNLLKMSATILEPNPRKRKAPKTESGLTFGSMVMADGTDRTVGGTSVFDPVLCELAYRWFSPAGGLILDPFAGGSVRGIVAGKLGRRYIGVDLRSEQIAANQAQAGKIACDPVPAWREGDSRDIQKICKDADADMIFSCPPYADLERYSDDPRDLSTLGYEEFLTAYRQIIAAALTKLKSDRFACFVVGDIRDPKGRYRNFVSHTIQAFADSGAALYNEAILVTAIGTLSIRVEKQFTKSRKLGKTHQNVLVFVKGDPVKATKAIGAVEFGDLEPAPASFGEEL